MMRAGDWTKASGTILNLYQLKTMNQQDQLFPVKCTAPPPKKRSVLLFEERLRSLGL